MTSKEEDLAQFASERLVANLTFNYIEGWTDVSTKVHTHSGKITFNKLLDFLDGRHELLTNDSDARTYRFRVLSFPRIEHYRLKIGLPKSTYELIKRAWNLHEHTLETFVNNNGILSSFDTREKKCILMKVAASRSVGFDTLSLTHSYKNNLTNVIYFSLANESDIFKTLLASPGRCLQPTFYAAVLYDSHQRRVELFRSTVDRAILTLEMNSKFGGPGRLFGRQPRIDAAKIEFHCDSVNERLSYVQTELAVVGHMARTSVKCGEWLVKIVEKDKSHLETAEETQSFEAESEDDFAKSLRDSIVEILDEVEYVKRRAETVVSQLQGVQDRVQSQTTFLLNTATQNQSGYTAAIALETRRDSAAMKTIAVLTILFLPGTFVATVFSMDMFQWQPNEGREPKVSNLFWVYWVVTVPLTALVMMGWLLWTKKSVERLRRWDTESGSAMKVAEKRE